MKQVDGTKRCPRCGQTKGLESFHRNLGTKDGYQVWCKDCHKVAMKANQLRNRLIHMGKIKENQG